MSKNNNKKYFDNRNLNIIKEIDEEIGRIKTISIIPNTKNKQDDKIKGKKIAHRKTNQSSGDNNNKNNSNQISQNSSILTDKKYPVSKKGNSNVLRAKVFRKYDHVERVEIDLVGMNGGDSMSINDSNNIYENDKRNKRNYDKSSEYSENINKDNNCCSNLNEISIALSMIENRWKNNCATTREADMPIICDEIINKKREMETILNRWNENRIIVKEDKLSIFNDHNNILNKLKKSWEIKKEINLDFFRDEKKIREKEIFLVNNRWNILDLIKSQNLSILVDQSKIKEKEINNIIKRWSFNSQSIKIQNISYIVDELEIKRKEILNIINRWKNNNVKINLENLFVSKIKDYENKNIINKWNNNNQYSKLEDLSFLVDEYQLKKKEFEKRLKIWNKNNKITNDKDFSFLIDYKEIFLKNLNKWNNNIRKENGISLSYKTMIDKNIFKYSEKQYIRDLKKNIYVPENNQNNYFILNYENNEDNLDKIKYKIIKPKNQDEFESDLFSYLNEKINLIYESDDLNKDNNQTQLTAHKETHITPIFIMNDDKIKQLNEIFNKKEWKNDVLSISKQPDIIYEIIKPNFLKKELENASVKIEQFEIKGIKKICKDFGETTPLYLLSDKYNVYAVSRNIKYSIQSPQKYITYLNNKIVPSYLRNSNINHFSLCIEKIDKLDSFKNSELNETLNKK